MPREIAPAVISLCSSWGSARVRGSTARRQIDRFFKTEALSRDEAAAFFTDLGRRLGPFEGLPEAFRRSLSAAAAFRIQEKHLLSRPGARFLAHGPMAKLGAGLVHAGWKLKGGRLRRLHPYLMAMGRKAQMAGRRMAQDLDRRSPFTRFYRTPFLHIFWRYIGFDPEALLQDYIEKIPVDYRISPVFRAPSRRSAACGLVGIDLLPARGKLYYLEANFNVGHHIERHRLTPQGDTVPRHLFEWAAASGYASLVFFPTTISVFEKGLEDVWRKMAVDKGIRLDIVDDPVWGSRWQRSARTLMDLRSTDRLYVNGRSLAGPLARLISEKGLLEAEINRFNATAAEEHRIPVPRMIVRPEDVPAPDEEGLFPNIIVKNARVDQARGVSLYRSAQLPEGANAWPRLAYEYVIPDLVVVEDRDVARRYVSIFRSYLLITPDGPVYLGARKDVSSVAIPGSLPFGLVADIPVYITNLHLGAHSEAHSEAEDEKCRSAVLSLGAVIDRFLRKKYELTAAGF